MKSNAGRKPLKDKKQRVTLFIRQSIVNKYKGMEKLKQHLYSSVK